MKTFYATSEIGGHYTFEATNISDARHWVINHLDISLEWTLGELINPVKKMINEIDLLREELAYEKRLWKN